MLLSAGIAQAEDLELFVRNRPFSGQVVTQSGALQASLPELLQSLGYNWSVSGRTVSINTPDSQVTGDNPELKGRYTLQLDGRGLPVSVHDNGGVPYVNVEAFANAVGLQYKVNRSLGCADLIAPVEKDKVASVASNTTKKAKKAKSAGGTVTTDGTSPDSPLRLIDMPFTDSTVAGASFVGEVRTSAVITNTGNKDVKNVYMRLDVVNANGDSYHYWEQHVPVIKAGETYNFLPDPPMWNNYSYVTCFPRLTITHDAIPEDEEEEE